MAAKSRTLAAESPSEPSVRSGSPITSVRIARSATSAAIRSTGSTRRRSMVSTGWARNPLRVGRGDADAGVAVVDGEGGVGRDAVPGVRDFPGVRVAG